MYHVLFYLSASHIQLLALFILENYAVHATLVINTGKSKWASWVNFILRCFGKNCADCNKLWDGGGAPFKCRKSWKKRIRKLFFFMDMGSTVRKITSGKITMFSLHFLYRYLAKLKDSKGKEKSFKNISLIHILLWEWPLISKKYCYLQLKACIF